MHNESTANQSRDDLVTEFQNLIKDTEKFLHTTADVAGEEAKEIRDQINETIKRAQTALQAKSESMKESIQLHGYAAKECTEEYVTKHPWQAIGLFTGVGLVLGLLLCRR